MKTPLLLLILVISTTIAYSQSENFYDIHKKITIENPSQETIKVLQLSGIDLKCGVTHGHDSLTLELSNRELESLQENNISYTVEVENLQKFYSQRAEKEMPQARVNLEAKKAASREIQNNNSVSRPSISNVIQDNIIQYTGQDEINWAIPQNYHYGTMGSCLTISEVLTELDEMKTYSDNNGLDIVSVKQDASPSGTGQTTWGNPQNSITNNGLTYTGQGVTSDPLTYWDPQTIYYIRITGNQSITAENTKPQMLFTSMIHSREVSALMNNIYFMWYLIENYNSDPAIKELVDNNELYFVPVVNPDGLRWNEKLSPTSGGGLQRKNLRPNTGGTSNTSSSRGVDLNRNFDYFWGYNNIGSSGVGGNNGAASDYRGPSRASEPETQIMVDFILGHQFKTAVWNHSYANSIPHPYGGIPTLNSGREDEMHTWHEEMTRYNRYLYGATIFYESNGLPDDWMVGSYDDGVNPPVADLNGSFGSQQGILATTPEHGGTGFWPSVANLDLYAQNSVRISLGSAYYGGKYAKLHDLTQSNITTTTVDLDFGIERIGQTESDFTLVVTPITNIQSVTQAATETGMNVLEQRTVTPTLELVSGISADDVIEYNVKLENDNGTIYEADFKKYYNPTVLFSHDPDTSGLTGWTQTGGWNNSSVDAYSGNDALRTGDTAPYATNSTKTLTTTNSYDFSNSDEVLIQFYTKWDIERNYDFVEVLGSTDGSNWQSLSGKYTKPNATSGTTNHDNKSSDSDFQNNSQGQVYDGDRLDNWVMEEIIVDGSNNSFLSGSTTAQIRFNFRSDSEDVSENYTTNSEGFFLDDFKIIGIQAEPSPCIGSVVDAFPYNESFENADLGLWTQSSSDDIDWTRNQGTTISGVTGPDNASDDNNNSYYLYTEASVADNGSPNKKAYLSKCVDFSGFENGELQFDYHMYGSSIGTLSVDVSINDGTSYTSVFSISGEQHADNSTPWTTATVDLSAYDGQSIKLRFYGLTGASWEGDMAIDNINITADTNVLGTSNFDVSEWTIYPNPSSIGMLNIKMPNDIQKFDISISNIIGQEIYKEKVITNNNSHRINTESLKLGVYFITIITQDVKSTKKIVIQ